MPADPQPKFCVILTYGRTGSTLLQGLLNAVPGVRVRGENHFFLRPLFESWQLLRTLEAMSVSPDHVDAPTDPWFGIADVDASAALLDIATLVRRQLLPADDRAYTLIGFKEIRSHKLELRDVPDFLDFLEAIFPGIVYINLTRDLVAASGSGFWRNEPTTKFVMTAARALAIQEIVTRTRPTRAVPCTYDELTRDPVGVVEQILEVMALSLDAPARDRVAQTAQQEHSYDNRSRHFDSLHRLDEQRWQPERLNGCEAEQLQDLFRRATFRREELEAAPFADVAAEVESWKTACRLLPAEEARLFRTLIAELQDGLQPGPLRPTSDGRVPMDRLLSAITETTSGLWLRLANDHLTAGNTLGALRAAEQATLRAGDDAWPWIRLSQIQSQAGLLTAARRSAQVAVEQQPDDVLALEQLAACSQPGTPPCTPSPELGANRMTDADSMSFQDRAITEHVAGLSFADVGGLWGTINEKVTVALGAGAARATMMDVVPDGHELWSAFDAHMQERGYTEYRRVPRFNVDDPAASGDVRAVDFVHCAGVLYHVPAPMHTLACLRRLTSKYLLLGSMVVPDEVVNDCGRLDFSSGQMVFVPALSGQPKRVLARHFDESDVHVGHINESTKEPFRLSSGPNYGPWWWLFSAGTLRSMVTTAGFTVIDEGLSWEGRVSYLLCERAD
jgi:tetratricopeptide (TPR) repeat protein